MSSLKLARQLVRAHPVPRVLRRLEDEVTYYDRGTRSADRVTPRILARSLHYLIKLRRTRVDDESAVPLGASKYKGLPHLPPGIAWPDRHYFLAQLNLGELHPLDIHDAFPATGICYVFFSPEDSVRVLHYDGPIGELRVTPHPDPATLPGARYYLDDFLRSSSLVRFQPRAIFYLGSDAYDLSAARKAIPKLLRDEVAALLGGRVAAWDSDLRIFGRPHYWQGEDEDYGDRRRGSRLLLLQDEFGEGHIHVWIKPRHARERDYSRCWIDYSGT